MNADWIELLQLFNDRKIKYLIICGHAVMHYSEPRYTKDLALLIQANPENGQKVYDALKTFGAPSH